ncbi:MAG: hypothetical protein GY747_04055 [Planctomycetes bacterium]|nr:hypothetical protein [Planctomycetota bacterium]MCP4771927.1 hypothetical protein [Planctomycetota bacterium]MCP4860422.1 hypothetical protein [Planctomycetota bacterium]
MILVTSLLAAATASYSGTLEDVVDVQRDEASALRAEFAAESGLEYAQRRLMLNPAWTGTGVDGVTLSDGMTHFMIAAAPDEASSFGENVHTLEIDGDYGDSSARLGSSVRVFMGESATSELALIFLGENFKQRHGMVYGDILVTDRANKVNDWVYDAEGNGSYQSGGADADGTTIFVCTGVDGTVYKYRGDMDDYQWLGDEVVITENTQAPAWDLDQYLVEGPGLRIYDGVTKLTNEYVEETAVFILEPDQKLVLKGCTMAGGVVVYCPKDYDPRSGYRNIVMLKNGTCIGGGDGGVEDHIGLIAPGARLQNDANGTWMCGFHFVNEIGNFKYADIWGQLVILNRCQNLNDCEVSYYAPVAENRPSAISFGMTGAYTDMMEVFENFN